VSPPPADAAGPLDAVAEVTPPPADAAGPLDAVAEVSVALDDAADPLDPVADVCVAGQVQEGGSCRLPRTCAELGCGTLERTCTPESPGVDAVCGGCVAGHVPSGEACMPVDCGPLSAPENGSLGDGGTTFGSVRTFRCGAGFTLTGSGSRTCGADGAWSGVQPTCIVASALGASCTSDSGCPSGTWCPTDTSHRRCSPRPVLSGTAMPFQFVPGGTFTQGTPGATNQERPYTATFASVVGQYAWFELNSGLRAQVVGTKTGNGYGLSDMSGNVWEWVWDWVREGSSWHLYPLGFLHGLVWSCIGLRPGLPRRQLFQRRVRPAVRRPQQRPPRLPRRPPRRPARQDRAVGARACSACLPVPLIP
jgi:hypothetical protein